MPLLGEFALWISLPVAAWGMVLGYAGGRTLRGDLVLSAERSIYAVFGLLVIAWVRWTANFPNPPGPFPSRILLATLCTGSVFSTLPRGAKGV